MKRTILALGLASSAIAIAVVLYLQINGSQPFPEVVEADYEQATQVSKDPSTTGQSTDGVANQQPPEHSDDDTNPAENLANSNSFDERTERRKLRKQIERDIPVLYSLLIKHLDLTLGEKDGLLELLIEERIAKTHTLYSPGKVIDQQRRENEIATIIGDAKLQQFLVLEKNLGSYAETYRVESTLERNGVPVTEAQREKLFRIVADVHNQNITLPGADAESGTIEHLEYRLAHIAEQQRLVLEQATSVLSPEQVEYLFEYYQYLSYKRTDALEAQRKARADGEGGPTWYPAN